MTKVFVSQEDKSVNFLLDNGQECRYARHSDEYIIVYLSSHNGCNMACRFCHLTQTGQTSFVESTVEEMEAQAKLVLDHYVSQVHNGKEKLAKRVHFNWMAKGDPMSSSVIRGKWLRLTTMLELAALSCMLTEVRFNLSTIFPKEHTVLAKAALRTVMVRDNVPVIYYSLYSLKEEFRKRWLPKAEDPRVVLKALGVWQKQTKGKVVLHWAFIEGENDNEEDLIELVKVVRQEQVRAKFNLVRYNPFSENQGRETNDVDRQRLFDYMLEKMELPGSRIVPRVGFDVAASCGMFQH